MALTYVYTYQTGDPVFNNIGLVVSVGSFLGVFLFIAFWQGMVRHKNFLWLLLPIAVLCFDLLYYSNEFVSFFIPIALYVLLVLFAMGLLSKQHSVNPFTCKLAGFDALSAIERSLRQIFSRLASLLFPSAQERPVARRLSIGVLAAIPFIILFTALFASADALFSNSLNQIFVSNNLAEAFRFVVKVLLYFVVVCVLFFSALDKDNADSDDAMRLKTTDHITLTIVLALLNGLFALFNYVQVRYVLIDWKETTPFFLEKMTYADYVHQGFFQLVAACAIVALVVFLFSLFAEKNGRQPFFRGASILLILQTGIIAASALKRMALYQEAYGYTVLRLHVEWFIYFVMVVMVLGFIATILHRWKWYVVLMFVPTVIAFCAVVSINSECIVAKWNIDRYEQGKPLDTNYILTLSSDALEQWQRIRSNSALDGSGQVQGRIKQEQQTYEKNKELSGWRYENWRLKQ